MWMEWCIKKMKIRNVYNAFDCDCKRKIKRWYMENKLWFECVKKTL